MDSRGSSGSRKSFYIDLSVAREAKQYDVRGRYLRVSDASDTQATINIAIQENIPSGYETLKKNATITESQGFDRFYVSNAAQPGKSLRVIVSEGSDDYDVDNPSIGTIDSLGGIDSPVEIDDTTPIKVDDDDAQTALAAILAILGSDQEQRQGLTTLEGATYYSAANTTTTVITALANTGGFIIRHASYYNGAATNVRVMVDDNSLVNIGSPSAGGDYGGVLRDIFVPAGSKVSISSSNAAQTAVLWGEAL